VDCISIVPGALIINGPIKFFYYGGPYCIFEQLKVFMIVGNAYKRFFRQKLQLEVLKF